MVTLVLGSVMIALGLGLFYVLICLHNDFEDKG